MTLKDHHFLKIVQKKEVTNNEIKRYQVYFMICWPASRLISQINRTSCTILFNVFIYFSSLQVSSVHALIIRRNYGIYATLAFVISERR